MIDLLVEKTKENQTFRGDYMAWGLAEQDAEKRGYNAGVADGISQGISQGAEQKAIETAKNLISKLIPVNIVAECTGLTLESVQNLAKEQNAENIQRWLWNSECEFGITNFANRESKIILNDIQNKKVISATWNHLFCFKMLLRQGEVCGKP